ncbi:acyl-CoA dehydrogenase family protein [Mycobacterium sp. 236(2023)]|uniref:acyl-CoA dehydrogenase family protein n=1 Tax=Mycobacterium sp. 236(2023) TaxID=3038163 RepID=UPI0024153148|nr:acyl-CoA dehydrogenase family protein [Mycobacterium sp. 236(2023)]MDG4667830.1 acyl-CoA dehydrogenase family protein [Mycobacterium sp. 236(2023)]
MRASPSPESVLAAVRDLLPAIAASASDVDRRGAVDAEVIGLLQDAGYFALLQPPAFGGLGADPDVYLTATRELSWACTSTGWLAGWLGLNSWGLSIRDERVLRDIWGADPHALLCSSYAPTGRLHRVEGGFTLSGRWSRCTGAHHSTWLSAAALRIGSDGAAQDFLAVLVPRSDYVVESTWNGLGLRGIGADDVFVSGAFVPNHRTFSWLHTEQNADATALDRLPQPTVFTLAGTMPLLGAAQRALEICSPAADSDPLGATAMSAADIVLSLMQIRRNVADLVACVRAGGYPDAELVLRTRRDQVMACDRAVRAVRTAVYGVADDEVDGQVLERVWRDVQTARKHVASNVEQVLAVAGRYALGLNVDDLIW